MIGFAMCFYGMEVINWTIFVNVTLFVAGMFFYILIFIPAGKDKEGNYLLFGVLTSIVGLTLAYVSVKYENIKHFVLGFTVGIIAAFFVSPMVDSIIGPHKYNFLVVCLVLGIRIGIFAIKYGR